MKVSTKAYSQTTLSATEFSNWRKDASIPNTIIYMYPMLLLILICIFLFVLFCFVLFCFVLFCFVLFCFLFFYTSKVLLDKINSILKQEERHTKRIESIVGEDGDDCRNKKRKIRKKREIRKFEF